jgi:TolB protein
VVFVRIENEVADLHFLDIESGGVQRLEVEGRELFPSWTPDGSFIGFSRQVGDSFELMSLDLETEEVRALVSPAGRDLWPRWSADGERLAFFSRRDTNGVDDEIHVVETRSGEVSRITQGDGHDFCPAWSPDGDRLVFVSVESDGSRALQIVGPMGRELGRIGEGFFRVTEPVWSPDGRSVVYAGAREQGEPYRLFVETVPFAP